MIERICGRRWSKGRYNEYISLAYYSTSLPLTICSSSPTPRETVRTIYKEVWFYIIAWGPARDIVMYFVTAMVSAVSSPRSLGKSPGSRQHPYWVTPSGAIRRVMVFPCLSACRPLLLEPSCARYGVSPLLRWDYWFAPDRNGVATFHIGTCVG
jgi:hypothetical protein